MIKDENEDKKPEATKTQQSVRNEGIKQEPKQEPVEYDTTKNNDSIPRKRGWYWLLAPDGSPSTRQNQPVGNENRTKKEEPAQKNRENSSVQDRGWHWLLTPDGNHFDIAVKKRKSNNRISIGASSTDKTNFDSMPRRGGTWHWLLAADGSPATIDTALTGSVGTRKRKRGGQSGARIVDPIQTESQEDYDLSDSDYDLLESNTEDHTTDDEAYGPSESDAEDYATDDYSVCGDHHRSVSKGISPSVDPSDRCDAAWEKKFQLLVEYKQKHKTTRVPLRDPTLGGWVGTQRKRCKQKVLSKHRVQRLNSLGFAWYASCKIPWLEMHNRLISYKEQHNGSVNVPRHSFGHRRLANWVKRQRELCKRGELSTKRSTLLKSIGFEWTLQTPWMEMYDRLLKYKKKHGTTCVPYRYKTDPKLGRWVCKQRHCCKEKNHIDLLNKIGFEWKMRELTPWMEMYERLLNHKKKHGATCVPRRYKADQQLANWVAKQRHRCKEKDRIDLLNKIGFVWDASHISNRYSSW